MTEEESREGYWQSFADLGMGLVGLLVLVLVLLLIAQSKKAELDRFRAAELDAFNLELLEALRNANEIQDRQEGVKHWLSFVFKETSCDLVLDASTGKLESKKKGKVSDLYAPGSTALSSTARKDLQSCRDAFRRLAACMNPDSSKKNALCPDAQNPRWVEEVKAFRAGVDSLILQGNTDRSRYKKAASIQGLPSPLNETPLAFVENAYLGGERARQAMGHLLHIVDASESGDAVDAMDQRDIGVLMSRLRLESASFGRYQIGPENWRASDAVFCSDDSESCEAARNLALKLRWSRKSLRRPFSQVVKTYCEEWSRRSSPIRHSIHQNGREGRANELCASYLKEEEKDIAISDSQDVGR